MRLPLNTFSGTLSLFTFHCISLRRLISHCSHLQGSIAEAVKQSDCDDAAEDAVQRRQEACGCCRDTKWMSAITPVEWTSSSPGRMQISTLGSYMACYLIKYRPMWPLWGSVASLTVAPEHMDVQLFEQIQDECVDLWQQTNKEDDGKTQNENCRDKPQDKIVKVTKPI